MFRFFFRYFIFLFPLFLVTSLSHGQTENFTQQVATFLPQHTFFLASLETPVETLKRWKSSAPGKMFDHPQIQNFIESLWEEAWKLNKSIVPPKEKNLLKMLWQSFSLADQGMALVAFSRPDTENSTRNPDLLWIARASTPEKIQSFSDFLVHNLLDGDRELLQKQNMNELEFYELLFNANTGFGPYFACTKNYFIAGTSLNTFLEVLNALKSQTPLQKNLRQNPSFVNASTTATFSGTNHFFAYFSIEECLQKEIETVETSVPLENQRAVVALLKRLYEAQNHFQQNCFKDRDSDGVGEFAYFSEISGTQPVPKGTDQGAFMPYPLIEASLGESSRDHEGIVTHSGYHFTMYLPSYQYAIIENGQPVPPASDLPENLTSEEAEGINVQENRWTCYAWPVEREKTGNMSFVINQAGNIYFSENANYNDKLIPPPEACYSRDYQEESQNLVGDIYSGESACDGFEWKIYEEKSTSEEADFSSIIKELLEAPLSRFLGLEHLQFWAVSLQFQENKVQDKIVYQFKNSSRLTELWGKGGSSGKSLDLCPEKSCLYGSITLNVPELKEWIRYLFFGREGDSSVPLIPELQNQLLEEMLSLLGEEVSFFAELPSWGFLPKGAIMVPLKDSQKFFDRIQELSKEGRYVLKNAEYLGHRFYYYEPQEVWFVEPFLISFTYIQGHLVLSYNPEGIKSVIHTVLKQEPTLRSSAKWRKFSESISGSSQGIFFSDNQQVVLAFYEIVLQFLLIIRPQWSVTLPKSSEIVDLFSFSGTIFKAQSNQIQLSSFGDAFGSAALGYTYFQMGLMAIFYQLVLEKPSLKKNEIAAIGTLRTLATSQYQFQSATVKDRDIDGSGEFGYFTELSGVHPVPVADSQGSPVEPAFLSRIYGTSSSQNNGIASKSGYYFLIYLPSAQEGIRENGLPVPPLPLNQEGSEKDQETVNLQESYWICYAWPIVKGDTGNRCFVVTQSQEIFVSENASYSGLDKIPTAEACFSTYSAYREIKKLTASISNDPSEPAFDGFIWQICND